MSQHVVVQRSGFVSTEQGEGSFRLKAKDAVNVGRNSSECGAVVDEMVAQTQNPEVASVFVKKRHFPIMPVVPSASSSSDGGNISTSGCFAAALTSSQSQMMMMPSSSMSATAPELGDDVERVHVIDEALPALAKKHATVNVVDDAEDISDMLPPGARVVGGEVVFTDGSTLPISVLQNQKRNKNNNNDKGASLDWGNAVEENGGWGSDGGGGAGGWGTGDGGGGGAGGWGGGWGSSGGKAPVKKKSAKKVVDDNNSGGWTWGGNDNVEAPAKKKKTAKKQAGGGWNQEPTGAPGGWDPEPDMEWSL